MSAREAQVGPLKMFVSSYGKLCTQLFWLYCEMRSLDDEATLLVDETQDEVRIFELDDASPENTLCFAKVKSVIEYEMVVRPATVTAAPNGWDVVYHKVGVGAHDVRSLFGIPRNKCWITKMDVDQLGYILSRYGSQQALEMFQDIEDKLRKSEIEVEHKFSQLLITGHNLHLWPTTHAPRLSLLCMEVPGQPVRLLTGLCPRVV